MEFKCFLSWVLHLRKSHLESFWYMDRKSQYIGRTLKISEIYFDLLVCTRKYGVNSNIVAQLYPERKKEKYFLVQTFPQYFFFFLNLSPNHPNKIKLMWKSFCISIAHNSNVLASSARKESETINFPIAIFPFLKF